jgi:hypothetical protein
MNKEVDSITIRVAGKGGDYVTADSFLSVVREAISILHDLDANNTLVWKLKHASINSPVAMTFVAEPRRGVEHWEEGVSATYVDLFSRLESGTDVPAEVPAKAVLRTTRLVDVLNNGVGSISFSAPGREPVSPTQRVQAKVKELVAARRDSYTDYVTLEGMLETVSVHGGDRFHVYDRITGHRTLCEIQHEDLERAKVALECRVWVRGRTRYKGGKPIDMRVDAFGVFPGRNELPQFPDIQGIDVTGGIDSVEFVRRQRDAG